MDLLRFDALVGSMDRIVSLDKLNAAWINMASAQCTVKGMKTVLKPLEKRIDSSFSSTDNKSADAFKERLKKGF